MDVNSSNNKNEGTHDYIPTDVREIHIDKTIDTKEWQICCSHTNQHALKYIIQVIMGASVMLFSMGMIFASDTEEDNAIYYSLLSGTLGYFLPHPSLSEN